MKVSVVTCAWDRAIQLKHGVNSLINQDEPPDEIIVVDDGSRDNTTAICRSLKKTAEAKEIVFKYIYLDHPEPRVSCIPRNVGLKNTSNEIVLFAEPEVLHVGNTIRQMKEKIENETDKIYLASQIWSMGRAIWKDLKPEEFANPAKLINHKYAQLTDADNPVNTKAPDSDWGISGSNHVFAGCLFGTLKKHFMVCRGFDESFVGYGWDDWDMIKRIEIYLGKKKSKEAGRQVASVACEMCDDIIVIHQWHTKNYTYDIWKASADNGKIAQERLERREHRANIGKEWGNES